MIRSNIRTGRGRWKAIAGTSKDQISSHLDRARCRVAVQCGPSIDRATASVENRTRLGLM